jgi:tRNA pseudouridine38-40 synthase
MRFALGVEYCGHAFCGFQSQPSGCGVQDALERAIGEIAGHAVNVTAAGRTDAGVHAVSQVVHFETDAKRPDSAWVRGVNTYLPTSAAILWARHVPDDFHARFAATARHYTYLLLPRPERLGLLAGYAGWYHQSLDVAAMGEGAMHLRGTHDFSTFRAAECQAKTPVKTLSHIGVMHDGPFVRFEFSASGFLHHMVRNIVGALVFVGAGRHDPAWIAELLSLRDRTRAAPTFGAEGLYLTGADYDARFGLPATVRAVTVAGALAPK